MKFIYRNKLYILQINPQVSFLSVCNKITFISYVSLIVCCVLLSIKQLSICDNRKQDRGKQIKTYRKCYKLTSPNN